jgi:L-iditol 2-dehydrogenase
VKAQVFRGVNQLSYEEVPVPTLEADEVLVQVRVVGLCQSDIKKIRYPLYEPPRIFGHETLELLQPLVLRCKGGK